MLTPPPTPVYDDEEGDARNEEGGDEEEEGGSERGGCMLPPQPVEAKHSSNTALNAAAMCAAPDGIGAALTPLTLVLQLAFTPPQPSQALESPLLQTSPLHSPQLPTYAHALQNLPGIKCAVHDAVTAADGVEVGAAGEGRDGHNSAGSALTASLVDGGAAIGFMASVNPGTEGVEAAAVEVRPSVAVCTPAVV